MKDDSFINLSYFLSVENTYNEALNLFDNKFKAEPKFKDRIKDNDSDMTKTYNNTPTKIGINNEIKNMENIKGKITKKIIQRKTDSKIINGGIDNNLLNYSLNSYIENNETKKIPNFNLNKNNNKNFQNNIMNIEALNNAPTILNNLESEKKINYNKNAIENINNFNIKNSIFSSKEGNNYNNDIQNNKNINYSLCFSATPKKNTVIVNNLFATNINTEINNLNDSDINNISTNRNEKLNLTINSTETNDLQEIRNEYKILSNNNNITQPGNIYSKKYLSNIDPKDYEYDTFCHAIIKTGLSKEKMNLTKYSENFPAQCGHQLCSRLPAIEPKVLNFYQNNQKINKIDIKQEATSHLIFPLGIKLCINPEFQNENMSCEPLINTIYNEKGDLYYIASLTIFKKITIKNYNNIFTVNPIDVYNKIKEEQNLNEANLNNNIINKNYNINNSNDNKINNNTNNKNENSSLNITNSNNIDALLKYNPNDFIYIPECISLISRFPFFNQLSICLKTIINMRRQIVNGSNDKKIENQISNFINHIINQIPIASKEYNLLFYTPISIEPIILYNPFLYNFGNFTCQNIFSLLSIDNIITIFLLILLEQKIIFVDVNHIKLSSISYFFLNLIYPLTWVNTYQPLLSLSTIRYIQSITPFIMGGNENLILYAYHKKYIIYNEYLDNIDKSNILFVDLTNNLISCDCYNLIMNKKGQNRKQILKYLNLPDLPKSIEKKLYNHLNDIEKIENINKKNEKMKIFFCSIMVFILDDYRDYCFNSTERHIFNKDNYLMNKKTETKLFYKELLGTQLFTQFIFNENENYRILKINMKKLRGKNITYGILHDESYKDHSFFKKNKNKIEELKIMIKQKRKEKITKSIKSAKKIVKNLGQLFYGISDDKMNNQNLRNKSCIKRNNSSFITKKKKAKNYNIMLMPYFIEELNMLLTEQEKYDYIQNKLNSIMSLDNQLNQINNYKNKYIFDFNQNFDLNLIQDDKTRYFIGTLNQEKEVNNKILNNLNSNINYPEISKINGKNKVNNDINNNSKMQPTKENEDYINSKEKINSWFLDVCLSSTKRKFSYLLNLNEDLKTKKSLTFFSKLISQNYKTLFDIKENNQKFLSNEGFIELLQKIKFILSKLTYDEYDIGKKLTLVCFKYYTFMEENKSYRFSLYNKYTELFNPCQLWLNHIFWKTWFDEDISYIEKDINLSHESVYSFELNQSNEEENELYEYNEENNNLSIEYRLLIKIRKVMNNLNLEEKFINKVIYEDLAINYLTENEINLFKEQFD